MLIDMKTLLDRARKEKYGVIAPSCYDDASIKASFESASELKSPVIINAGYDLDLELMAELTKFYSKKYPEVPVALNLDHGRDYDDIVKAIRAGFTSVMVDRSRDSFEDNVAATKEIVRLAHIVGVSVEAELGHVPRGENKELDANKALTDPKNAKDFVELTGVDCLAVAIGNVHGQYTGKPHLNFELLEKLQESVQIPLVLHGGSSSGDENLQKSISYGITKINIGTDLGMAGSKSVRNLISEGKDEGMRIAGIYEHGMKAFKEEIKRYMILFNSNNRY